MKNIEIHVIDNNNSLTFEEADCLICGFPEYSEEARGIDYIYNCCKETFHIVKCNNCGHLYLRPRPSPSSVSIIYPHYYATLTRHYSTAGWGISKIKSYVINRRMNILKEKLLEGSHILDVGCGDGQLLIDFSNNYSGLQLTGLDWKINEEVKKEFTRHNINIMLGRLEDVELPEKRYDLVIMNQLIEHLWDARYALQKISNAMKPGGLLSIETVNCNGYDRRFFKTGYWGGYYIPRHMNFFSHHSLQKFLEDSGFTFVKHVNLCAPIVWVYSLHAWAKSHRKPVSFLAKFFSDINPLALSVFTTFDLLAMALGTTTSNQKIIARKN